MPSWNKPKLKGPLEALGSIALVATLIGLVPSFFPPAPIWLSWLLRCVVVLLLFAAVFQGLKIATILFPSVIPHPLDERLEIAWADSVRHPRTEEGVRHIGMLDREEYGESSVSIEGLLAWYHAYPKGVWLLCKKGIVGGLGLWPVTEAAFEELVQGRYKETDLKSKHICSEGKPFSRWYLADLIVDRQNRNRGRGILLAEKAIEDWLNGDEVPADGVVELCSLGMTAPGKNLLRSFGLDSHGMSPDGYAVFHRAALVSELKELLRARRDARLRKHGDTAHCKTWWGLMRRRDE
jgi:hypothetical protein